MPQKCRVCHLPAKERKALETKYVQGTNIHQLTKMYGISDTSIKFHVENHLPERLVSQAKEESAFDSSQLLKKIDQIHTDLKIIYDRNFLKQRDSTAIKAAKEMRNTLQLLVQITVALRKTEAQEKELEQKKQFREVTDIQIEQLSPDAQELLFEITQKQLEDINHSHPVDYDRNDVNSPSAPNGGGSEVEEDDSLKKTRIRKKLKRMKFSQPEYERHGMTFQPITENRPAKDFKLQLRRRTFARAVEDVDDTGSTLV